GREGPHMPTAGREPGDSGGQPMGMVRGVLQVRKNILIAPGRSLLLGRCGGSPERAAEAKGGRAQHSSMGRERLAMTRPARSRRGRPTVRQSTDAARDLG